MNPFRVVVVLALSLLPGILPAQVGLTVNPEVEHLRPWGEKAQAIMTEWQPRIVNLLAGEGFTPPPPTMLIIAKGETGIAGTTLGRVTVYSNWIEKRPEDLGLAVHELVHVVQAYPAGKGPVWVTEGVADYIRCGVYEAKPMEWFPRPKEAKGYQKGYQVAGGFLLWLETGKAPGIVRRLNSAMRLGTYQDAMFEQWAGKPLDALWAEYVGM